jgi:hypothetical protein
MFCGGVCAVTADINIAEVAIAASRIRAIGVDSLFLNFLSLLLMVNQSFFKDFLSVCNQYHLLQVSKRSGYPKPKEKPAYNKVVNVLAATFFNFMCPIFLSYSLVKVLLKSNLWENSKALEKKKGRGLLLLFEKKQQVD